MQLLEMKNIHKSFGELEVLRGISLTVEQGEVLGIIGPSGSGKSTLLRCATMLEIIDRGDILVKGEALARDTGGGSVYASGPVLRRLRKSIGLVFQNFNLFPHFSVLRNVTEAPVHVAGMDEKAAREKAMELLTQMGLSDKSNAYPYQLSGGQQQRVSIARALAMEPDVLFFDEPTSALDPELTGEILRVIRDLASRKMTMVIVTHEMSFARDVADQVIFMDEGVIVEQGPAHQVIGSPEMERTRSFLSRYNG